MTELDDLGTLYEAALDLLASSLGVSAEANRVTARLLRALADRIDPGDPQ